MKSVVCLKLGRFSCSRASGAKPQVGAPVNGDERHVACGSRVVAGRRRTEAASNELRLGILYRVAVPDCQGLQKSSKVRAPICHRSEPRFATRGCFDLLMWIRIVRETNQQY